MKPLYLIILTFFSLLHVVSYATVKTAASGNWNSPATWSPYGAPSSGDTLIIPSGVTVNVNCNCGNNPSYASMEINLEGTLNFPGGRKINLASNGTVNVFSGGLVTGSNNGDKLNIGNATVWTGKGPNLTGPTTCTNGGCFLNPVLPVTLISFIANSVNGQAFLEWKTATETNCSFFTIEKSQDGENWTIFSKQPCSENSTSVKIYRVNILSEAYEVYYRLSQTDIDGESKDLGVVVVNPKQDMDKDLDGFSIHPNPANTEIMLLKHGAPIISLSIYDLLGRQVLSVPITGNPKRFRVDLGSLEPGGFVMIATDAFGRQQNKKIVIQR